MDGTGNETTALEVLGELGAAAAGIPLPPQVKRSAFRALGSLIKASLDWPTAWLESKAEAIRDDTAGRSRVTVAASTAAAKRFGKEDPLGQRAVDYFGSRILKEQHNREAVAEVAIEQLRLAPPSEDSTAEIEGDWLEIFAGIAEKRSSKEMQAYFGRILAGEIRRPGSFSPGAVESLARLTGETARTFQRLCGICTQLPSSPGPFVFAEAFGSVGRNGLKHLGFPYETFSLLQEAGLVHSNLDTVVEFPPAAFAEPFAVGNRRVRLVEVSPVPTEPRPFKATMLTQAGRELFGVVDRQCDDRYVAQMVDWLCLQFSFSRPNTDEVSRS